MVIAGNPWQMPDFEQWQFGLDLQSQHIDFGPRKATTLTFGLLLEYKLTDKWALQFESSQLTNKTDVRFGNFSITALRVF
jgi:hypothetical protein